MIVIYHGNCIDGFTAAWVAWLKYGSAAQYVPAKYGEPPPLTTWDDDVLVVDFSYPRAVMESLAKACRSLQVLDHHKTAEEDLRGLPCALFDMNRSGAGIAWDFLYAGLVRPPLVDYVEDRDLWRFAMPKSKEVNAVIGGTPQSFEAWRDLDTSLGNLDGVAQIGTYLLRSVDRYVDEMSKVARTVSFEGHDVPVVNAPYINTSELVGKLAESATFAVGWHQRSDASYVYSLRSRGDFDVSELAKKYGGGGHKNAAGFHSDRLLF